MSPVIPPPWLPDQGRAVQLMILLHGVGSEGAAMAPLARVLRHAFPQAALWLPDGFEAFDMGPGGRQWFSVRGIDEANRGERLRERSLGLEREDALRKILLRADDEAELGARPFIVSVSLGASRRFQMRRRDDRSTRRDLWLHHGDLLVMADETQSAWLHRVPRERGAVDERVSLTLRHVESGHRPPLPSEP